MKVTLEAEAFFPDGKGDDVQDVPIEIVDSGHEPELDAWAILIVHPKVTLKFEPNQLYRALKPFVEKP